MSFVFRHVSTPPSHSAWHIITTAAASAGYMSAAVERCFQATTLPAAVRAFAALQQLSLPPLHPFPSRPQFSTYSSPRRTRGDEVINCPVSLHLFFRRFSPSDSFGAIIVRWLAGSREEYCIREGNEKHIVSGKRKTERQIYSITKRARLFPFDGRGGEEVASPSPPIVARTMPARTTY